MKLWVLAISLGLLYLLVNVYGFFKPAAFGAAARRFPRNTPIGYPLMVAATAWFIWNVYQEPIADFAAIKPYLCGFFGAIGIGACLFVKDYLPVRALAVILLLMAKLMVDTARWVDTPWRLVVTTWAYVWIAAGMWWTVSPWRLRDLLNWGTATEARVRRIAAARAAFGLLVLLLGLTVFRAAEARASQPSQEPVQMSGSGAE
jgi:hypothetical protein